MAEQGGDQKRLPDHIEQKSDKWYFNTKTSKYIHADNIETWLERYWRHRTGTLKPKAAHKTNIKYAKKRWDLQ